ncbi:hypothetical protein [Fluviispira multicolorata]|uniref:Uncharacterized protein n=1 Tax=Fluviispira multicolorata TaxID=2654512 RepID=A0A833JAL6_9BACT|nr:hypothetical protein [Fluviispira multicolorata]KAB8028034.1 hypothetical protein GCL57_13350 [Fluviispira multicolorata]
MSIDLKNNICFSKEIYKFARDCNIKVDFENYFKSLATNNFSKFFCHHIFDRNTIGNDLYKNFCLLKMQEAGMDISSNIENIFTYIPFTRSREKIKKVIYLKYFTILFYLFLKNLYYKIYYIIYLLKIKFEFRNKIPLNLLSTNHVIFTFVDESLLLKDKFIDRYFPKICELSNIDKKQILLIAVLVGSAKKSINLEKIRNDFENAFIPEQLVSILDIIFLYLYDLNIIFKCFYKIIFIDKLKNNFDFFILKELLCAQPIVGGAACCGEGIIKKLKKMKIFNLRTFISSFENLVYEKRCNLALRKYYPECVIIGTQHSTIIDTQLSNWPLDVEIQNGLCPDVVLSNGPKYINVLKRMLSVCENNIILKIGPTLRYNNNLSEKEIFKNHFKKEYCLVLGSIDPYLTLRSITFVINYIGRILPAIEIVFKNHPMCALEKIKENINQSKINFDIAQNINWLEMKNYNLEDLIFNASFIFSYSQGSILDIISLGKTPILIGSDNSITMVPIIDDDFNEILKVIFNENDLGRIMQDYKDIKSHSIKIKNWYNEFYLSPEEMSISELFFNGRF